MVKGILSLKSHNVEQKEVSSLPFPLKKKKSNLKKKVIVGKKILTEKETLQI